MSKLRNYLVDEVLKDFQSVETSFFVETSSTNSINESAKPKQPRYWELEKVDETIFIPKEFISEWVETKFLNLLKEISANPTSTVGKDVDDGPNFFFANFDIYDKISKKRAERIGYSVFNQIMSGDLEDYYEHPIYPNGPVRAATAFPAGVIGKLTPANQKDYEGPEAYDKWYRHVTRSMALVGYSIVSDWDKKTKEQSIEDANNILQTVTEDINIPINVGDTVLGGKFKNKKIVVKDIGKNERGDVTINGKPLLKYRLIDESVTEAINEEIGQEALHSIAKIIASGIVALGAYLLPVIWHGIKAYASTVKDMITPGTYTQFTTELSKDKSFNKKFLQLLVKHGGAKGKKYADLDEFGKDLIESKEFKKILDKYYPIEGYGVSYDRNDAIREFRIGIKTTIERKGSWIVNTIKKKFPEETKDIQVESILSEIPMSDLQQIDKYADKQLNPLDIVITDKHFLDRLVDPRNKKPISVAELTGFFKRLARKKDQFVDFLKKYGEIVAKDNRTKINIPFMKQANKAIAKTIMRKDDFKTPSPELKFESVSSCGCDTTKNITEGIRDPKKIKQYYESLCKSLKITPLPVKFESVGKGGAAVTFNKITMKPLYISFDVNRMSDPEFAVIHELTHQIKLETEKDAYVGKRDKLSKFTKLENKLVDKFVYSDFSKILWEGDAISGGLSQGMELSDIAKRHNVSLKDIESELKNGIEVEKEHTTDENIAKEIAMDHLFEDPKYYTKLASIENPKNENLMIGYPDQKWIDNHNKKLKKLRTKLDAEKQNEYTMMRTHIQPSAPMKGLEDELDESNPSDVIKDLDKVKNDLLKKVNSLIAKKKKLYSNVDIESPMSKDEKELDKEIADIFSQINKLVVQKRTLKKENKLQLKEYTKGQIFGGKIKIGGEPVEVEVELLGADNKKNVFITKIIGVDKKWWSKIPKDGILEIPARIFRTPGGGWFKVKTPKVFENVVSSVKDYVVVYAGRFQPFHKGHFATYQHLVKKFGKDNVYIGTSDKTDNVKSPFNFNEKKVIMTGMFGIPVNKIVQIKNPYAPVEILKKFDEKTTGFITVVGGKDAQRLGGKYFTPYKGTVDSGYSDKGYVYISPSLSDVSGTDVRNWLGSGDIEDRKKLFTKAYPKFNEKIFNLIVKKLDSLKESVNGGNPNQLINDIQNSLNPLDTRTLLLCGGSYGHMNHPFDIDVNLTFGQLKDIVKKALNGELELTREKCITGDAVIHTEKNGDMTIAEFVDNNIVDKVLSFNEETGQNEYMDVMASFNNDITDEWLEIELEDGKTIQVTPNHRMYVEGIGYVEAKDLMEDMELKIV